MAKENFFKRFLDSFRDGEEGSLNDRLDEPLEKLEETTVEEDKPFIAKPLAGVADMAESRFYTGGSGPRVDTAEAKHVDEHFRQEHEPYRFNNNGDMQVCISSANIYEINPKNASVKIHELSPLIIECTRDCVVYGNFQTDNQGRISSNYILGVAAALPDTTHFELPNEDDPQASSHTGYGSGGDYYIPICWIVDGKIEARQFDASKDGRTARLMGSVMGQRGPLIWNTGYNKLKNIGGGKNVYRNYIVGDDHKELRTIKDKGGSCSDNSLGDPFCGSARVRVHYDGEFQADGVTPNPNFDKANADSIIVRGNNYNNQWYVGAKRAAVVEDGLVNDMVNLPVETLDKKQLDTVTVVTGYSSSSSNVTAAAYPTASDKVNVLTASGTPVSAAPPHAESDRAAAWSGGSTGNAYTGGTAASAAPPHAESDRGFAWSGGDMLTQAIYAYDTASCAAAPTSSDATTLYAGGSSPVNAYTGGSSVSVATGKTTEDAWTGGGNGQIVTGVTSQERTNMWKGGRVVEGAGLEKYKVLAEDEYGNDLYIWVLGITASVSGGGSSGGGDGEDDPPDFPRLLTDDGNINQITTATAVSSVTAASGYGIVGNSVGDIVEKGFVDDLVFTTGGIVGATTTPVVGRTNPVSVLKDTLGEVTNVVKDPQTTPVITGANYSQKFLKGEASPVTGLKKDMTDTTVIANAVDTQKFLKGEASPVSVPVAGSPVSVIKGSLPSVSISVPVATGTAEVYQENTSWTGGLLDAANVSASQGLKVVKEPETETTNCCTGG